MEREVFVQIFQNMHNDLTSLNLHCWLSSMLLSLICMINEDYLTISGMIAGTFFVIHCFDLPNALTRRICLKYCAFNESSRSGLYEVWLITNLIRLGMHSFEVYMFQKTGIIVVFIVFAWKFVRFYYSKMYY